jgi:glucose-1-phosphate thymidylyltransferase
MSALAGVGRELLPDGSVALIMGVKGLMIVEDAVARPRTPRPGRLDALEHVANRPIAHHVLDALQSAGVDEIVVASSQERAAEVRECFDARRAPDGLKLRYVTQRGGLDIDGALNLALPIVQGAPCIVHVASGLLSEPLATLTGRLAGDWPDVVLIMHQGSEADGSFTAAVGGMPHVAQADPEQTALGMAGVCLFGPEALARMSAADLDGSDDGGLKRIADRVVGRGGTFDVLLVNGWRHYGGDPLDRLELNRIALDRLENDLHQPTNNGNRIEGRVRIHEHASVEASVIVGPTVIGRGAHVADAYIGPYTSIGAGARVEGAEIERSIVDAGASITHVGGRLVASVVGRDARVFKDFSLPRALRLRVGDGTVVALC